jgi:hypothetical protein
MWGGGGFGGLRSPEEFLEPLTGKNILCGQIVTPRFFTIRQCRTFWGFLHFFVGGGGGGGTKKKIFKI